MPKDETQAASKADIERLTLAIESLVAHMDVENQSLDETNASKLGHTPRALADKISGEIAEYVEAHPVRSTIIAFLAGLLIASRGHR